VEEARQHSAVTTEQQLFTLVYRAGLLVLSASLVVQAAFRLDALFPAIIIVGGTRIFLAAWRLLQPRSFSEPVSLIGQLFVIVVWFSAIVLLLWIRFR
jgi:hypothetical protein